MKVSHPKKSLFEPFCQLFSYFQKVGTSLWPSGRDSRFTPGNLFPIWIFTLCFLFSFNSFAVGGGLLKLIHGGKLTDSPPVDKSHQSPTPEETEALARQRHDGIMDNIHGISERAIHHLARDIDEQFDRTLDEILETRNGMERFPIDKEHLPKDMLNELRAATTDPLRLFDLDDPQAMANAVNFNSAALDQSLRLLASLSELDGIEDALGYADIYRLSQDPRLTSTSQISDYRDIYRAFFQKRLDPEDSQQMYRLRKLLDRLSEVHEIDISDVLRFLFKHEGLDEDAYKNWSEGLAGTLYRDDFYKSMADDCFKDGFDEKTFFTLWEDESFRQFIVDSRFMTKDHLAGNTYLLIQWKQAQLKFTNLMDDQLNVLIRSSLNEASLASDVEKALLKDPFWQTLIKAGKENLDFSEDFERRLQRITPVEQDQPSPPPLGGGSGGLV